MHPPIREGLEGYLAGKAEAGFLRHLDECADCRRVVTQFEDDAKLVRELRAPADFEPAPGFYGRVMDRVEQQRNNSIWSVFLEPLFARRLMYATAALTLVLGVFLFTSPKEDAATMAAAAPEQMLAEELPPSPQLVNAEDDRNVVFVQFATYQGE